jgi:hypothetical protein
MRGWCCATSSRAALHCEKGTTPKKKKGRRNLQNETDFVSPPVENYYIFFSFVPAPTFCLATIFHLIAIYSCVVVMVMVMVMMMVMM